MNPMQKTIEAGGMEYTFRFPSQNDLVQIDLDALKMRGGITNGLSIGFTYSQNIAMMKRLCVSPKDVDFGDLPSYVGDKIGRELTDWVNSFSGDVDSKQGTVGS